jgi:hypothetical protein
MGVCRSIDPARVAYLDAEIADSAATTTHTTILAFGCGVRRLIRPLTIQTIANIPDATSDAAGSGTDVEPKLFIAMSRR